LASGILLNPHDLPCSSLCPDRETENFMVRQAQNGLTALLIYAKLYEVIDRILFFYFMKGDSHA
jgi:hypothetical protein